METHFLTFLGSIQSHNQPNFSVPARRVLSFPNSSQNRALLGAGLLKQKKDDVAAWKFSLGISENFHGFEWMYFLKIFFTADNTASNERVLAGYFVPLSWKSNTFTLYPWDKTDKKDSTGFWMG